MIHLPAPLPLWSTFGGDGWADAKTAGLHMRDDCAAYWACLARASTERWRGWSCVGCRAHSPESSSHITALPLYRIDGDRAHWYDHDLTVHRRQRLILAALADLECGIVPVLAVTTETDAHDCHGLLDSWGYYQALHHHGADLVRVVRVGVSTCPLCRSTYLDEELAPPVLRDGWCRTCQGFVAAAGAGVRLEAGEELRSREAQSSRRGVVERVMDTAVAALSGAATAAQIAWDWDGED